MVILKQLLFYVFICKQAKILGEMLQDFPQDFPFLLHVTNDTES